MKHVMKAVICIGTMIAAELPKNLKRDELLNFKSFKHVKEQKKISITKTSKIF